MSCGVPQRPILDHILFSLYMLPLSHIIHQFNIFTYHCYANATQLYVSFKSGALKNLDPTSCLHAIKD